MTPLSPRSHQSRGAPSLFGVNQRVPFPTNQIPEYSHILFRRRYFRFLRLVHLDVNHSWPHTCHHASQISARARHASNTLRPLLTCRHHLEQLRCLFQFQSALPDLVLVAVLSQRVHLQSAVLELILDLKFALCGAPERACECRPIFAHVFAVP